ncbi:MAG: SusC/RagA family TonB-linked outer membrane protein [Chitinophagia bacterium]
MNLLLSKFIKMFYTSKKFLLFITFSLLLLIQGIAQEKVIVGKIVNKNGMGINGALVQANVSKRKSLSDSLGNFRLAITGDDKTIQVSSLGFTNGSFSTDQKSFNLVLEDDSKVLTDVVVTAYGIKKEVKRLGYTVQEVKGADLIKAREPNAVNGLAGKVAGLTVGANTEMLGRPELVLRGSKDLLFVVDGSPINSDTWNISADDIETYSVLKGPNAAALYGSRGINGAIVITTKRGSKDKKGWQLDFNSSNMFEKGFVASPEAQTEYGRGNGYHYEYQAKDNANVYVPTADALYDNGNRLGEFGPRFEGQLLRQYDSPYDPVTGKRTPTPWLARGVNNFNNFVETGLISTNNVAVSSAGTNYNLRISYTHMYQKGIFPNTKLNSDNMNLFASYNLTSKLSVEGNMNLNLQYTPNIPDVNYGPNSYIYMFKVYGSADYDVNDLKDFYKGPQGVPDLVQYAQEYGRLNNPYFMAYKWLRGHDKTDIYSYIKLNYKLNSLFNLSLKSQITTWNQTRTEQVPSSANLNAYTPWYKFGWYGDFRADNRKLMENNTDLQLSYNQRINKWNISALVGGNSRSFTYNSTYGTTRALAIPNIYVLSNSVQTPLQYSWNSKMQTYSGYYSIDVSFDKYINLNTTGRVDNLSTLPSSKNTFFYPSASISSVLSDYISLPKAISFLKVRGSVADVKGAFTSPTIYSAYKQVTGQSTNSLLGYGTDLVSSYDGPNYANTAGPSYASYYNNTPSVSLSNTVVTDVKPYDRISFEAGVDMKFLKNRVGLDFTYFDTKNGPGIYSRGLPASTTFNTEIVNGITTKRSGIEIAISGTPIKNPNGLNWDVFLNYATFKETLSAIYGNDAVLPINNHNYKVGDRLDEIFGTKFLRDGSGNIVYSGGVLQRATGSNDQRLGSLGFLNPDFTFGFGNKFTYKNFSFSFQIDGRIGGKIYDYNYYAAMQGGTHIETVQGAIGAARLKEWQSTNQGTQAPTPSLLGNEFGAGVQIASGTPTFLNGAISNLGSLTFAPNTTSALVQSYLTGNLKANFDEYFMISRSFAKLREVVFSYNINNPKFGNGLFKTITVSVIGRNLLYFAKRKDFDIDQYASGFNASDLSVGGSAIGADLQSTSTRKFGFNLNFTF